MVRRELIVLSLRCLGGALALHDLWRLYLRLSLAHVLTFVPLLRLCLWMWLLGSALAFVFPLLESPLTLLLLPLLQLLPDLLPLTCLMVTAGFFLQSPPFSPTLYP
jgi:hypothetical protein